MLIGTAAPRHPALLAQCLSPPSALTFGWRVFQPEVAKRWLRDREAREAAARGPDDRDRRRWATQRKSSSTDATQPEEPQEDPDVADVTKKMAKMNK